MDRERFLSFYKALKKSWSFLASVTLHILVLFFLIHTNETQPLKTDNTSKVEIAIVEKPGVFKKFRKLLRGKSSKGGKGVLSLHQLTPTYGDTIGSNQRDNLSTADNVGAPWGSGGGEFKRISEYNLMERIHSQMEGLLYYPGVLAAHKIEGSVNARLVLNEKGRCDWSRTQISSGNPYFRVYILDTLKKLCRQSYAHEVHGRKLTNVDLSFQFAITEHDNQKIKDEQSHIVGNVLLFYRNSHQSIAQWHLGPFTGLFPIPFVQLDFVWLEENWETYIEHKDPLGDYKESKD